VDKIVEAFDTETGQVTKYKQGQLKLQVLVSSTWGGWPARGQSPRAQKGGRKLAPHFVPGAKAPAGPNSKRRWRRLPQTQKQNGAENKISSKTRWPRSRIRKKWSFA